MDNFKNKINKFLNYIPGFRHRNKIIMILSFFYYVIAISAIITSPASQKIGAFLFIGSVAFFVAYTIDLLKKYNILWDAIKHPNENRKLIKKNLLMILLSVSIFFFGGIFIGMGAPKVDSKPVVKTESENVAITSTVPFESTKPIVTLKPTTAVIVKPTTTNTPTITKSTEPTSVPENTNEIIATPSILPTDTSSSIEEPKATQEPKLETAITTLEPTIAPTEKPELESFPTAQVTVGEVIEVSYIGNSSTRKFHEPNCRAVKKMNSSNIVKLNSREKAINSGYDPCGICNP